MLIIGRNLCSSAVKKKKLTFNLICVFKLSLASAAVQQAFILLTETFAVISWINRSYKKCKVIFPCG